MYKIGISGKSNSGKNTLATLLQQVISEKENAEQDLYTSYSFQSKILAFADPIKYMILNLFPQAKKECLFGPSQLRSQIIPGTEHYAQPLTYRQALLDFGERSREYNDNIWIDNLDYRLKQLKNINLVVVSDLRRTGELEYLRRESFFLIRLYRKEVNLIKHISETELSQIPDKEFDYVLTNDKSLSDLKEEIKFGILPKI